MDLVHGGRGPDGKSKDAWIWFTADVVLMMNQATRTVKVDLEKPAPEIVADAVAVLKSGGVVALPTDTLYGLSASLSKPDAIARIIVMKRRDPEKPMILLVGSRERALRCAINVTPEAKLLMKSFWPGPVSLILSPAEWLPDEIRKGGGIAIRQPSSKLCAAILDSLGEEIVSTSANISGSTQPRTCSDVLANFATGIDLMLDGGPSPQTAASTVVDARTSPPVVLREGVVPAARINSILRIR